MSFFLQQHDIGREWNIPVVLALVLHIMIFGLSVTLPKMMHHRPLLDEIVTVNLVSLPEVEQPEPVPKAQPLKAVESKPSESTKVEPAKAKVQVAEVPESVPEPVQPVKPVSLKPLKRKVQKTDPEEIAREEVRRKQEKERQQALAKAKLEEEQARLAAEEARAALAAMIRQKGEQPQRKPAAGRSSGGREITSIVVKNYLAALHSQVQQYWVLPDMQRWDPRLETVVVLYISRDGSVKTVIERKSTDPFYDQFVMKTIESAQPLPPLPKMITEEPLEVGLVFKPGELLM